MNANLYLMALNDILKKGVKTKETQNQLTPQVIMQGAQLFSVPYLCHCSSPSSNCNLRHIFCFRREINTKWLSSKESSTYDFLPKAMWIFPFFFFFFQIRNTDEFLYGSITRDSDSVKILAKSFMSRGWLIDGSDTVGKLNR